MRSSCDNLEAALKRDGKSYIDANELYVQLRFLQDFIPKEDMGPIDILKFLKRHDYFPNATIAYRVLLTTYDCRISRAKLFKTEVIEELFVFYNDARKAFWFGYNSTWGQHVGQDWLSVYYWRFHFEEHQKNDVVQVNIMQRRVE